MSWIQLAGKGRKTDMAGIQPINFMLGTSDTSRGKSVMLKHSAAGKSSIDGPTDSDGAGKPSSVVLTERWPLDEKVSVANADLTIIALLAY